MPATISVNFATQAEVESVSAPSNKSVSASVLRSVLGSGGVAGGYVTLGTAQTVAGAKTFSAAVTLNTAPTLAAHATTKAYVDAATYQQKYTYTIASATSTITASTPEANGRSLSLPNALNLDVYRNGVLLVNNVDYTVAIAPTNTITFTTQLAAGAVVQVNQGGVGSVLANAGVQQIVAGGDILISPTGGTGAVTVSLNNAITITSANSTVFNAGGATANIGRVTLIQGDATNAGRIEWYRPDGTTRMGYMGYGDGTNINLTLQNGSDFNVSGGNLTVSGELTTGRGAIKAWVNFNGVNLTPRRDANVSTITRVGTGSFIVNYSTAIGNATYSFFGCGSDSGASGNLTIVLPPVNDANAIQSGLIKITSRNSGTGAFFNAGEICVAIIG